MLNRKFYDYMQFMTVYLYILFHPPYNITTKSFDEEKIN